jgi:hypothetical protein
MNGMRRPITELLEENRDHGCPTWGPGRALVVQHRGQ